MSVGADNAAWVRRLGKAARGEWQVAINDDIEGWAHTGLLVAELDADGARELALEHWEAIVVPLSGSVTVECSEEGDENPRAAILAGRDDVLSGPTDVAYLPAGTTLRLHAHAGAARVAVTLAKVDDTDASDDGHRPRFTHLAAGDVPVELRGAGIASREVRNFGVPGVLGARKIIACEVVTPAGNWSSWPPHKHDEDRPGVETELE